MTDPIRAALAEAIEALTWHYEQGYPTAHTDIPRKRDAKALRHLKSALAEQPAGEWVESTDAYGRRCAVFAPAEQPAQKAVAWVIECDEIGDDGKPTRLRDLDWYESEIERLPVGTKLYPAAQPAQAQCQTERESWGCKNMREVEGDTSMTHEHYECKVCGRRMALDYEEMK